MYRKHLTHFKYARKGWGELVIYFLLKRHLRNESFKICPNTEVMTRKQHEKQKE